MAVAEGVVLGTTGGGNVMHSTIGESGSPTLTTKAIPATKRQNNEYTKLITNHKFKLTRIWSSQW